MKISKSKRVFSFLIATTFALFGLLVLFPVSVFADTVSCTFTIGSIRSSNWRVYIVNKDTGQTVYTSAFIPSAGATFTCDLPLNAPLELYIGQGYPFYMLLISGASGMNYTKGGDYLGNTSRNFTVYFSSSDTTNRNNPNALLHFSLIDDSTPTPSPTPTPTLSPTPDPAEWLNNYIFNQTSEDMWVGVEDINADDVTYDVIPAWSYKNFYFKRNTTYRIIARTEQDNVYYSLQYYTDLYNYVPLEYSLSAEGWYTYTEMPYTSINISTGSDTNTSGIYTFVRFRHDLPTLPPVTPEPGSSSIPGFTNPPYVTPIPGNPTLIPDNSTPTPIPDISGEAVAGFNKLTNIFNGLFDAAYQSVNASNGNFWTSFFFIGLPIFLVILGLIAWIIFGLSDDD